MSPCPNEKNIESQRAKVEKKNVASEPDEPFVKKLANLDKFIRREAGIR